MKAWVAAHTGLPSFYVSADERIEAPDGRVLRAPGSGAPILLSDALATPGTPTTYRVGASTVELTRADSGHMLTDTSGRSEVPVQWIGEDEDSMDPRASLVEVSGRRSPIVRYALRPASVEGTLAVRTRTGATRTLRGLVGARGPLVAIHSPSACEIPDCDIPPVRVVTVTRAESQRVGRVDAAVREWDLTYREVSIEDSSSSGTAPLITWADWVAYRARTGDLADHSYLELARLIAGMPS